MKSLFKFYLMNYRIIHHIFFIIVSFSFIKLVSFIFPFYDFIFHFRPESLIIQILVLVFCYIATEDSLKKSGINDELIQKELDKLK